MILDSVPNNLFMDLEVSERVKRAGIVSLTIPGLAKPIAPFQNKGVAWLYSVGKGILADDVGLGKSVQSLATAALVKDKGKLGNVYIGCLGGHERHWVNQINEWLPGVFEEIGVASGLIRGKRRTRRERAALYNDSPRILISNYHLLRNDIDLLEGYGFGMVILDECTAFKNVDTKLFSAVKRLTAGVPRVIGLTATPFEKALIELYAIQDVLGLELFGSLKEFQDNFETMTWLESRRNGYLQFIPKHTGYKNLSDFKAIISPHYLRREGEEVGIELPELLPPRNIVLEMSPSQSRFYKDVVRQFKEDGSLGTFTRLTQICDAPWVSTLSEDKSSPKLDELVREITQDFADYKVVVFVKWHRSLDLIGDRLDKEGIGWVPFTGKQDTDERNVNKDQFIDDPYTKVLVTTTAGEKGVDGLQVAKGIIAFNQLWNPQRMRQVVGRVRRLGSKHKVITSTNYIMADSIEEKLWELLMSRAELFDSIFDTTSTVDMFTDTSDRAIQREALKAVKDML